MKLEHKLGVYFIMATILTLFSILVLGYGVMNMPSSGYLPLAIGIVSFVISQLMIRKHFTKKEI